MDGSFILIVYVSCFDWCLCIIIVRYFEGSVCKWWCFVDVIFGFFFLWIILIYYVWYMCNYLVMVWIFKKYFLSYRLFWNWYMYIERK